MPRNFQRTVAAGLFAVILVSLGFSQKLPGLAPTPPMGWNSWNKFGCDVNEALIRQTADAMSATGMKDAGYEFIVIDDCWQIARDAKGNIVADSTRFPSGMKALADYVHSKGLKFGLYSCAGTKTCAGRPGGHGYEKLDAEMYARWGVDYLKYDWCNTAGQKAPESYKVMRDALYAAARPIVFSICEWGDNKPWEWAGEAGNLWRTTGDISPVFDGRVNHGTWSSLGVMTIVELRGDIRAAAGPGHWNDPDMLEVGNGMSVAEDRSHFTLWCMMAAPLMSGNDLRSMSPDARVILTNTEVIAVDQDLLGIQGFMIDRKDSVETWAKPMVKGEWAVAFLNRSITPKTFRFDWATTAIKDTLSHRTMDASVATYGIRDLWLKKDTGTTAAPFEATIPSHDIVVLKLVPRLK
jgi:alpha-galactosidase